MIEGWLRHNGRKVGQRIKGRLAARFYLNETQSRRIIDQEQYLFFPLQYVRESRVTVRAPPYYDVAWFVEYLSRSLPHGYRLVVKDHPNHAGALPFETLRTIGRFADFIPPELNAHDVIKESEAVITLNNTVGYEAIIHGKPVIVMGEAFYDGAGHVWKPESIEELPRALAAALEANGLTEEATLSFAHRIIEGSYPGDWGDRSPENVERLVDSILAYHSQTTAE
jgi:capsule polysaccharide modification protein KpsS